MKRVHHHTIRHPFRTLLFAILATAVATPGVLRLEIRTDGFALLPGDAPAVRMDREIRAEFGVEDAIVVLIRSRHPRGLFNEHTLRLVRELTADLQGLSEMGTGRVTSLATEHSHRVKRGSLEFRTFLDPLPETPEQLGLLRDDLHTLGLYAGTLVSHDERATAVLVEVRRDVSRLEVWRRIHDLLAARDTELEDVYVIGAPVAEALLGSHILDDLGVPDALLGRSSTHLRTAADPGASLYGLRQAIGQRVGLLPFALLVMAAVFFASFRGLPAVALPLTEVGACLAAVFGLMGWAGSPVYLTTAVLPVILTAVGVADEVHIFARYAQLRRERPVDDPRVAVADAMDEMGPPIVKTSITTAVGFLSFAVSPIEPVRTFGIFAAVGILFCMLWSLTAIPALLVILQPRVPLGPGSRRPRPWTALGRGLIRHRRAVLVAGVVAVALLPWGIGQLEVWDTWIGGFAPESEFFRATSAFNDVFFGTHVLLARVDLGAVTHAGEIAGRNLDLFRLTLPSSAFPDPEALVGCSVRLDPARDAAVPEPSWSSVIMSAEVDGDSLVLLINRRHGWPLFAVQADPMESFPYEIRSEPLVHPVALRRLKQFEDFARGSGARTVGGVLGPVDYLEATHFIIRERREDARTIPDAPHAVRQVWEDYDWIRGESRLREVVTSDYGKGLVSIFLDEANFADTARLMEILRDWEREHLTPHGIRLDFAGDVAVSQCLIDNIVTTQVRSLVLSLIGIFLVIAALNRSVRWGVYGVLPCGLGVATVFAVMGWSGVPLGVASSMFAGMTLGIGVDFSIHLIDRYRRSVGRGLSRRGAVSDALDVAGPAILIDGLAVALGFSVLTLSQVPANARLGGLLFVAVVTCLAATLLLLPALLSAFPPRSPGPADQTDG